MQSSVFVVNAEPYCLWEVNISERNREFLDGLDADFFDYTLKAHASTEDEKRAAVALKLSLHHGLETLFSLLGAYVQAPDCAYAWIAKCSNNELRSFVQRVSAGDSSVFTKLPIAPVTWDTVADAIFRTLDKAEPNNIGASTRFAGLWSAMVNEFISETHVDEYNSLKHGFRVKAGGFALAVGVEPSPGVAPPNQDMHTIGKSDFGATFFRLEQLRDLKGDRNVRSRRTSVNWSIERTVLLLQFVHMSVNNVVSALKTMNGAPPGSCKFLIPTDPESFGKPWQYSTGVLSVNIDYNLTSEHVPGASRSDLLALLGNK